MQTIGQFQASLDYIGTVRGRAGYLVTPTLLLYGTAGLAYANANLSASYATIDLSGIYGPGFASRFLFGHAHWLDRRWRRGMDVHAKLERQAGVSVL